MPSPQEPLLPTHWVCAQSQPSQYCCSVPELQYPQEPMLLQPVEPQAEESPVQPPAEHVPLPQVPHPLPSLLHELDQEHEDVQLTVPAHVPEPQLCVLPGEHVP